MNIKKLLLLIAFVSVPAQVAAAAESRSEKWDRLTAYEKENPGSGARRLLNQINSITLHERRVQKLLSPPYNPEAKEAQELLQRLRSEFNQAYAKFSKKFSGSLSQGQQAQIDEIKSHLAWIKQGRMDDVRRMYVRNIEESIKKLLKSEKHTRGELDEAWNVLTSPYAMYGYMGIHDAGRVPKKKIRALLERTERLLAEQQEPVDRAITTRDLSEGEAAVALFDLEGLQKKDKEFAALAGKFTRIYQPDEEDEQLLELFKERHAQLSDTIEKQKKIILKVYSERASRLFESYKARLSKDKERVFKQGKLGQIKRIIESMDQRVITPLKDLQLRGLTEKQRGDLQKMIDRYLTMVHAFTKFQAKRKDVSLQEIDSLIKFLEENLNRKRSFFLESGDFEKTQKRLGSISRAEAILKKKKKRLVSRERKIQEKIEGFLEAAKEGSSQETSQAIFAYKEELYKDRVISTRSRKYQQLRAILAYSELKRMQKRKLKEKLSEDERKTLIEAINIVFEVLENFAKGNLSIDELKNNLQGGWEAYKASFPLGENEYEKKVDKHIQKLLGEKATRPVAQVPPAPVPTVTTTTTTAEIAADQDKATFIAELSSIEESFKAGLVNTGSVKDAKGFTNATVRDDLAALHNRYNADDRYDEIEQGFKARIRSALEDHISNLPA